MVQCEQRANVYLTKRPLDSTENTLSPWENWLRLGRRGVDPMVFDFAYLLLDKTSTKSNSGLDGFALSCRTQANNKSSQGRNLETGI